MATDTGTGTSETTGTNAATGNAPRAHAFDRVLAVAGTYGYKLLVYGTIAFLLAPLLIVVAISFQSRAYAAWPPGQFTLEWYTTMPEYTSYLGIEGALIDSLLLAVATAAVSTTIGGMAAYAIVRYEFPYSTSLETVLISPLIYPWLVIGLSILLFIGELNTVLGLGIRASFGVALAGHVLFTLPYPIRTIGASLQNFPGSVEEASRNLGATELDTFLSVTLPLIRPGIISGAIFAFVLSFNQYIVSLFLTGPQTKTMPLLLFEMFYNNAPARLAAIATLLMAGILALVMVTEYVASISEFA